MSSLLTTLAQAVPASKVADIQFPVPLWVIVAIVAVPLVLGLALVVVGKVMGWKWAAWLGMAIAEPDDERPRRRGRRQRERNPF
jgi:hypothetical protein